MTKQPRDAVVAVLRASHASYLLRHEIAPEKALQATADRLLDELVWPTLERMAGWGWVIQPPPVDGDDEPEDDEPAADMPAGMPPRPEPLYPPDPGTLFVLQAHPRDGEQARVISRPRRNEADGTTWIEVRFVDGSTGEVVDSSIPLSYWQPWTPPGAGVPETAHQP